MLEDLTVLEISEALTGPFTGLMMADLGAEVIKVEPPEWRRALETRLSKRDNMEFLPYNRGKKSIILDFVDPEGRKVFEDLVKKADVVISNYTPKAVKRLGLGYDSLGKINPRIICCNISGYGLKGNNINLPAYDISIQAVSGMMSVTGELGGSPIPSGQAPADINAGIMGGYGILAAYIRLLKEGVGQQVDISMFDNVLPQLARCIMKYELTGILPEPRGSATSQDMRPCWGSYQTKDSYVVIAANRSNEKWRSVCKVMGKEELADDPRFDSYEKRIQEETYHTLVKIFEPIFRTKTTDEWLAAFTEAGHACTPVNTIDKVIRKAEDMDRGMIVEYPLPSGKIVKGIGNPIKVGPKENLNAPPEFGQHTKEVLSEKLNFDETRINELVKEKIIVLADETG